MVMYAVSQEIRVVVVLYIANIEDLKMIKNDRLVGEQYNIEIH